MLAASAEARARGLHQEMNLSEARALCPGLIALELASRDERRALEALAEALGAFSPFVALDAPHGLQLEIGASPRGFGDEVSLARALIAAAAAQGYRARIAVAGGAALARLIAMAPPHEIPSVDRFDDEAVRVVPPGRGADAEAVDAISLTRMDLSPALARSLSLLGLERLGEVARLPRGTVPRRFGPAGLRLQRLARGIDESRPEAYVPRGLIRERQDFEEPLASLEPLLFCCKQLLERVEARLRARAAATTRLLLRLALEGPAPGVAGPPSGGEGGREWLRIEVPLTTPFRAAHSLLRICRARLGAEQVGLTQRIQSPIVALEIWVLEESPYKEASADLFRRRTAQEEGMAALVARLIAALGEAAVFAVRAREVWRPEDAFERVPYRAGSSRPGPLSINREGGSEGAALGQQLERPLRLFERPEPASWEGDEVRWRGVVYPIHSLGGAERLQGEWWAAQPLDRDYYVLDLQSGDRLWLFEEPDGELYVQGCFD